MVDKKFLRAKYRMVTKYVLKVQWDVGIIIKRVVNGLPRVSTLNDVANGLNNPLVSPKITLIFFFYNHLVESNDSYPMGRLP